MSTGIIKATGTFMKPMKSEVNYNSITSEL